MVYSNEAIQNHIKVLCNGTGIPVFDDIMYWITRFLKTVKIKQKK
jgi:hypothetical protein